MLSEKTASFTGKWATTVAHFDSGFSVCKYREEGTGKNVTVVGTDLPKKKQVVTLHGEWVVDPRYGRQFRVEYVEWKTPGTSKEIIDYISKLKIGVGKRCVQQMLKLAPPPGFWNAVKNNPEIFLSLRSMTEKKMEKLSNVVAFFSLREELNALFGSELKMTEHQFAVICRVFKKSLKHLVHNIRKNPYILSLAGYRFPELDHFANSLSCNKISDSRVGCAFSEVLYKAQTLEAHACLPYLEAAQQVYRLVNDEQIYYTMDELLEFAQNPPPQCHLVADKSMIYGESPFEEEALIAETVSRLTQMQKPARQALADHLSDFEAQSGITLSKEQENAVAGILQNHFSVLTGGPGTGKSTILKAVLYCWSKIYESNDWRLLAPTGIAARRLTETTGEDASTIHSALRLWDDEEASHFVEPFSERLIIVDEASMLDQTTAKALFEAIPMELLPYVVLVGDVDQLPSVRYGNVLQELIGSETFPVYRLHTIYRQAQDNPIAINAAKINAGETDLLWNRSFRGADYGSEEENAEQICQFYKRCVDAYGIKNVLMLSPYRKVSRCSRCTNADYLNEKLQELVNPDSGQAKYQKFRVGDRVMQKKNTETVRNGDLGTISAIAGGDAPTITVMFDAGEVEDYDDGSVDQLELAYAMSIHKSQGTECKVILMILGSKSPFLRRSLVYTGITRAKEYFALCGPLETLQYAIRNDQGFQRYSQLSRQIRSRLQV